MDEKKEGWIQQNKQKLRQRTKEQKNKRKNKQKTKNKKQKTKKNKVEDDDLPLYKVEKYCHRELKMWVFLFSFFLSLFLFSLFSSFFSLHLFYSEQKVVVFQVLQLLAKNNVIAVVLPGHTSGSLQPLDVGVFFTPWKTKQEQRWVREFLQILSTRLAKEIFLPLLLDHGNRLWLY